MIRKYLASCFPVPGAMVGLVFLGFVVDQVKAQSSFSYTGAVQTYTVPSCVHGIKVDLKGASGANSSNNDQGGRGGRVQATVPVTPGEVLKIYVGGSPSSNDMGWNGGGAGGVTSTGGGGATDIRRNGENLNNRIVIAGGGGGSGFCSTCSANVSGGPGGGPSTAGHGFMNTQGSPSTGKGGSQTTGGAGGTEVHNGQAGGVGVGGNGGGQYGGGGGGGYYGGGGGATNVCCWGGGGGGGSSYILNGALDVIHTQGGNTGHGSAVITANPPGPMPPGPITGPASGCKNTVGSYSISPVQGADSLFWTVPAGTVIDSGQGTPKIWVTFGDTLGDIAVVAKNSCGSSPARKMAFSPIPFSPMLSNDTTVCKGNYVVLTASGGDWYSWSPATGLSCTDCPSPWANPDETTTYKVTIGKDGCGNKVDSVTVTIDPCSGITPSGISGKLELKWAGNGIWVRSLDRVEDLSLELFNISGRSILRPEVEIQDLVQGTFIPLTHLPKGIYILRLQLNNRIYSLSLPIQG